MLDKIDFNNINDEIVYQVFKVDGNEADALNDSYLELFELIGRDAMLKLFTHFRGDKIDCPMRLYRPEFIADLAKNVADRRERAKIARAARTCRLCPKPLPRLQSERLQDILRYACQNQPSI